MTALFCNNARYAEVCEHIFADFLIHLFLFGYLCEGKVCGILNAIYFRIFALLLFSRLCIYIYFAFQVCCYMNSIFTLDVIIISSGYY